MLPLHGDAMVRRPADIYYGLCNPIVVAIMTLIIGATVPEQTRRGHPRTYDHQHAATSTEGRR